MAVTNNSNASVPTPLNNEGLATAGALGGVPVAERNGEYILVFDGIGGTGPELIDKTAYFCKYVVDVAGNVSKPGDNTIARLNVLQQFETGKNAAVIIDDNANPAMAGTFPIVGVGTQELVCHTQVGYTASSHVDEIGFKSEYSIVTDATITDYRGAMGGGRFTSTYFQTSNQLMDFDTITDVTANTSDITYATSSGEITIVDKTQLTDISFLLEGRVKQPQTAAHTLNEIIFDLKQNGVVIDTITKNVTREGESIGSGWFADTSSGVIQFTLRHTVSALSITNGDVFTIEGRAQWANEALLIGSPTFGVEFQNPTAGSDIIYDNQLPYWTTSSDANNTWITASEYLSQNFCYIQEDISSSLFESDYGVMDIKVPFNPLPGDFFRFEYDKSKENIIYEVIPPGEDDDNRLKIRLNTRLPESTNLNNFMIHRINDRIPQYVILDVPKTGASAITGIVAPQFLQDEFGENLDDILVKLKTSGIIEG